jgi:hypothetical protein
MLQTAKGEITFRVLEICYQPQSEVEIMEILLNEYQVGEVGLAEDISSITAELLGAGLLEEVQ